MIFIFFILLIKNLDGQCTCERITDETSCIKLKCNWTNENICQQLKNSTEYVNVTSQNNNSLIIYNFCDQKCNQRQQCTPTCDLFLGCSLYNGSSIQECNQINLRCAYNGSGCIEKQDCSQYDVKYCLGQNNSNNQPCVRNYDNSQCVIKTCQSEQYEICQVDSCSSLTNKQDCDFSKDQQGNCSWMGDYCSVVFCQSDFFIDQQGIAYYNSAKCNLQVCEYYSPGDLYGCDQLYDLNGYQCELQNIYNCRRKLCSNYKTGEKCPDYCITIQSTCIDISAINCESLNTDDCSSLSQYCIVKDQACKQLQCQEYSKSDCTILNYQCVWNANQCSLIKDMYCEQFDLSICGLYTQFDGKSCYIEKGLCVSTKITVMVEIQKCETQSTQQLCYEASFTQPCIWFSNRCLSIYFCSDIPDPSKEQCYKFSNRCGFKENQCANIQNCSSYSKQDCYFGSDGPCSVNQLGKCQQYLQCSDIVSADNLICQQWNQNCISDGQNCVEKSQECQLYQNTNSCYNDYRCYVYDKKCAYKKCQEMDSYECIQQQSNKCFLLDSSKCDQVLFCNQFQNKEYCIQAGNDGTCYYSGSSCQKQTACFFQKNQNNCLYKDGCKWQDQQCQNLQCQDTGKSFYSVQFGWQYCNGNQQYQPQSIEECIIESDWNEIFINGTCISCDYIEQRPLVVEGKPVETRMIDDYSDIFNLILLIMFY